MLLFMWKETDGENERRLVEETADSELKESKKWWRESHKKNLMPNFQVRIQSGGEIWKCVSFKGLERFGLCLTVGGGLRQPSSMASMDIHRSHEGQSITVGNGSQNLK